jgi:hypothetical protein
MTTYKSTDSDQIPAELIQAGSNAPYSEINKLTDSFWNKVVLPQQWKACITVNIYKKGYTMNILIIQKSSHKLSYIRRI